MDMKKIGIALIIVGILFLAGSLVEYSILSKNKDTHEKNEGRLGEDNYQEWQKEEDTIQFQTMVFQVCMMIFIVLFLIGFVLIMKGKQEDEIPGPIQPQPYYQQQYQQQPQYPQQYPQHQQYPPQYPPQQPPQNPPY